MYNIVCSLILIVNNHTFLINDHISVVSDHIFSSMAVLSKELIIFFYLVCSIIDNN